MRFQVRHGVTHTVIPTLIPTFLTFPSSAIFISPQVDVVRKSGAKSLLEFIDTYGGSTPHAEHPHRCHRASDGKKRAMNKTGELIRHAAVFSQSSEI